MRTGGEKTLNAYGDEINPATEEKQDNIIAKMNPLVSPVSTSLTLTNADTPYLLPPNEQEGRKTLIIYNSSDADIFIGDSSVTTSNGIELASGGKMTIDCESGLYAVCGTSGKTINILEIK